MARPDDQERTDPERMGPGDEATPEHPSAAENICPDCGGSGRRDGAECEACSGRGVVVEAIGGG